VTWASVDAPLVELGNITATLLGSQTDHRVWIRRLAPSQTIYSWVMNNHWHTNYRAEQEGPTTFRYYLRPHLGFDSLAAARFGMEVSQPLLVAPASGFNSDDPLFELSSDDVLVTAFKPSDDGRARIIRLFGASGQKEKVRLKWRRTKPKEVWLSNTSEEPLQKARRSIEVPPWGIVTLRVEF
jgi:alpha-mannosidase